MLPDTPKPFERFGKRFLERDGKCIGVAFTLPKRQPLAEAIKSGVETGLPLILVEEGPESAEPAEEILREERFHRAQYLAGGGEDVIGLSRAAAGRIALHPAGARIARLLRQEAAYSLDELQYEIPAHLARGRAFWERSGISPEQARSLLGLYFSLIEREHGKDAADTLREAIHAEETNRGLLRREGSESESRTGAGPADSEEAEPTDEEDPGKNGVSFALGGTPLHGTISAKSSTPPRAPKRRSRPRSRCASGARAPPGTTTAPRTSSKARGPISGGNHSKKPSSSSTPSRRIAPRIFPRICAAMRRRCGDSSTSSSTSNGRFSLPGPGRRCIYNRRVCRGSKDEEKEDRIANVRKRRGRGGLVGQRRRPGISKQKAAGTREGGRAGGGSRLVGRLNRTTSVQIALRLPEPDVAKARELAARKGIGYQTLLKMLVHEGLRREARRA